MRTTLTLDADVHQALQEAARKEGKPFKDVLNRAVRAGLKGGTKAPPVPAFKQPVFALGRSRVDLTKALALADELADQEQVAKRSSKPR